MITQLVTHSLSLLITVGIIAALVYAVDRFMTKRRMKLRISYEYNFFTFHFGSLEETEKSLIKIQALGKAGWEIATPPTYTDSRVLFILKRETLTTTK